MSGYIWRQHDDGTYTVITDAVGVEVIEHEGQRRECMTCNVTEYLRCTDKDDPGGTEMFSRYEREDGLNYMSLTTLRDAERAARAYAECYGPEVFDCYPGELDRSKK